MCGIFGVSTNSPHTIGSHRLRTLTDQLFRLSDSRGKEAAGLSVNFGSELNILKAPVSSRIFIRSQQYRHLMHGIGINPKPHRLLSLIGHSRLVTNGIQADNRNNQPVVRDNMICVHNGIVVNDGAIWKRLRKTPRYDVDTEVLLALLGQSLSGSTDVCAAVKRMFSVIRGSASIAVQFRNFDSQLIATNTGSLYYVYTRNPPIFLFASERYILDQAIRQSNLPDLLSGSFTISHLLSGSMAVIDVQSHALSVKSFIAQRTSAITVPLRRTRLHVIQEQPGKDLVDSSSVKLYVHRNALQSLRRHIFDYRSIYALKRCTACILPSTTPMIAFDDAGVCNYCREHQKIQYYGVDALERLIGPYRSGNGNPDCIVAFSGGRDSSYGLHVLKKELGMNPIAYTYDWGMVTDVARRNEARIVGKLGVEHIIVSADITTKRRHIRQHIQAWMRKPDIGMVPLFMEGDKQCEFYVDQLSRRMNIRLVFFCRGNEYEKEEFKTGHCGIKNADHKGVIHNLHTYGKIKIAAYYARQYLSNPAYLNSSFFDTVLAYFSTYIQKHNYIFLWHYLPWDEHRIVNTLRTEYDWEIDSEARGTWRTDDGTSAFYNYIYYTVQGFTENDSFRSRQVREGKLNRSQAWKLVCEENQPRYRALQWYFDKVGLDGDRVLGVVDSMPRLY